MLDFFSEEKSFKDSTFSGRVNVATDQIDFGITIDRRQSSIGNEPIAKIGKINADLICFDPASGNFIRAIVVRHN